MSGAVQEQSQTSHRMYEGSGEEILRVEGLVKHFPIRAGLLRKQVGQIHAVDGVDFTVRSGETLGLVGDEEMLRPITGQPPSLIHLPPGCAFHPRCFLSGGRLRCRTELPPLRPLADSTHHSACHFAEELQERHPERAAAGGRT